MCIWKEAVEDGVEALYGPASFILNRIHSHKYTGAELFQMRGVGYRD